MRALIALTAAMLLLTACQNARNFQRPDPDGLQLGEVTKEEIVKIYGPPAQQRTQVVSAPAASPSAAAADQKPVVSGTFTTYNYLYRNPGEVFMRGNLAGEKILVFEFFNEKLFAYNFVSDVEADNSNFDESNISRLENGRTGRDEIEALLGTPTGRGTFPAAPPGNEKLTYQYVTTSTTQLEMKRLDMFLDDKGILQNFGFDSRVIPYRAPASAPMPVFIPPPVR